METSELIKYIIVFAVGIALIIFFQVLCPVLFPPPPPPE